MNSTSNVRKKKLIIIAFFLMILLLITIVILGIVTQSREGKAEVVRYASNSEELIEYDKNMMQYGKDIYILDPTTHSIIKHEIESGNNTVIIKDNSINQNTHFFIRSNQLIYSCDNITYRCDLKGENVQKLTNGEVVYINDDLYIIISHKTSRDELYVIGYDKEKFRTNNYSHNIANGKTIDYITTRKDDIYFSSVNDIGRMTILEVNTQNDTSKIVAQINSIIENSNTKLVVSDVIKDNEKYYFTVNEVSFTTNEDNIIDYSYVYCGGINEQYNDIIAENTGLYLAYDPSNKDMVLFEQFIVDDEEDSIRDVWENMNYEETKYNWEDLIYGDVTEHFYIDDTNLYRNDETFVDLKKDVSGYNVDKVIHVNEGFYFLINDDIQERIWYYCNEDGTGLKKIVDLNHPL